MKKFLLSTALFIAGLSLSHAQVGIGTLTPNASAELEVKNTTKGVLMPRVNLVSLTQFNPIVGAGVESLLVYNLTVNTTLGLDKGYYYWSNSKWQRIVSTDDVVAIVINNISTIFSNPNVLNQLITIIHQNGGNVYYDGTTLTYIDAAGTTHVIDLHQLVQDNETVTTLVNNGNGTYTYTNEAGVTTTINVPADVISNWNTISSNTTVLNQLINLIHQNGGNVYFDGTTFTYIDTAGVTHVINLAQLIQANQTITTLVNNGNGTYTYTNEAGTTTTINVPADVISNWNTISSNPTVLNQLINLVHQNGGNVYYDGTTFTYMDAAGVTHVINLAQTITTIVDNGNGTFTYTNEAGTPVTINYSSNNWKLNGNSLTGSEFLGSTNAQPLVFKTNNTERVRVLPSGWVGVNTASPTSQLDVKGSVSTSIVSKTSNYTATDSDYTIVYRHTAASTLTLPAPSSCTGRKYLIINNGDLPLTLSPAIEMASGLTTTQLSNGVGAQAGIVYGNRLLVQSDGTTYVLVQN